MDAQSDEGLNMYREGIEMVMIYTRMSSGLKKKSEKLLPRHAKIGLLGKVLGSPAFFYCDQVHI